MIPSEIEPVRRMASRQQDRAGPTKIVGEEAAWRVPSQHFVSGSRPRIVATRWYGLEGFPREYATETPGGHHVVALVLRNMNLRLSAAGRTVHDGPASPGLVHVAAPAVPVSCLFRGPHDVLHLHVPNAVIAGCAGDAPAGADGALFAETSGPIRDATVEQLGRALVAADQIGGPVGLLYADSIATAIVARLVALADRARAGDRSRVAELARWRLKRAMEFIDAHLSESITTAEISAAAGLKRMHFAAQFRVATGLRPHEYLLRRRIERAQELLLKTELSVVEVALSVGFQTQSHFTIVFNRFVGQPPRAWRRSNQPVGVVGRTTSGGGGCLPAKSAVFGRLSAISSAAARPRADWS